METTPEEEQDRRKPEPPPQRAGVPMGIDEVYKPSLEVMQQTLQRAEARRRTVSKWKAGRTAFRVLPPYKEGVGFYEVFQWHWGVGPESKGVMCRQTFGKRCYLCEKVQTLAASADLKEQDEAERMAATTRYFANVIVIGEEAKGVQVIELKQRMAKVLIELALDPEIGNFTDPITGPGTLVLRKPAVGYRHAIRSRESPRIPPPFPMRIG